MPAPRERLAIAGDLELNSSDVLAVRLLCCRGEPCPGVHPYGIGRETTLQALNVPADARVLKINAQRLQTPTGNLGNRFVVATIPAAQIEAIETDTVSVLCLGCGWAPASGDRPVGGQQWRAALRQGETRPRP